MTVELPFPDREPLRDWVAHGYRCVLYRAPMYNAVNGYVHVPSLKPGVADQVEVHGGVTFETSGGWIGFDACHAGDHWAGEAEWFASLGIPNHEPFRTPWDRWWTEDDVAAETERMALSVKALMEQ